MNNPPKPRKVYTQATRNANKGNRHKQITQTRYWCFRSQFPNATHEQALAHVAVRAVPYRLNAEEVAYSHRATTIRCRNKEWGITEKEIAHWIGAMQRGEVNRNGKPITLAGITDKQQRRKAQKEAAKRAEAAEKVAKQEAARLRAAQATASRKKPEKAAKVFPSTVGQLRYVVLEPEPKGGGYKRPFDVLIDADRVEAVRAKYEARNAIFRGPMLG